ncbi:MAG: hypothetical protein KZQ83_00500 [gamma proteobacterium symbiont of Taylorina sp.]|nr:hypothetical protein [gamma proteobacterium symbiont of Taylorina sp.]
MYIESKEKPEHKMEYGKFSKLIDGIENGTEKPIIKRSVFDEMNPTQQSILMGRLSGKPNGVVIED